MTNNYKILRSLLLLLLQYDPLNYLDSLVNYIGTNQDLMTSLTKRTDGRVLFLTCDKSLTFNEFLIELYFSLSSFHNIFSIHFYFNDRWVQLFYPEGLEQKYWTSQHLRTFLALFERYKHTQQFYQFTHIYVEYY